MLDFHSNDNTINIDNSFTELFSLIKKYRPTNRIGIDYTLAEMNKMLLHADNAITNILHGLQSVGNLIALASFSNKQDIMQIGYFLSLIGNLMEALNTLRSDCEYELFGEYKKADGER